MVHCYKILHLGLLCLCKYWWINCRLLPHPTLTLSNRILNTLVFSPALYSCEKRVDRHNSYCSLLAFLISSV